MGKNILTYILEIVSCLSCIKHPPKCKDESEIGCHV